jgi:hypothetical protein
LRVADVRPEPEVDVWRFVAKYVGPLPAALAVGLEDEDGLHQLL